MKSRILKDTQVTIKDLLEANYKATPGITK